MLWDGLRHPLTGETPFAGDPTLAFSLAPAVGLVGTAYFLVFGEEFAAYA